MGVRLGAARGAKWRYDGSAGDGQELGEGVRFVLGVPRAGARARLINKLIKFKEFVIFKIFKRIKWQGI